MDNNEWDIFGGEHEPVAEGTIEFCTIVPALMNDVSVHPRKAKNVTPKYRKPMPYKTPMYDAEDPELVPQVKTIKTCPGINELTDKGYILPLWCDLIVERVDFSGRPDKHGAYFHCSTSSQHFQWNKVVDVHPINQVKGTPLETNPFREPNVMAQPQELLKPVNPWYIRTAPGWDIMVLDALYWQDSNSPMPLQPVPGVFQADWWHQSHIPCFWRNNEAPTDRLTVIPAGTPLAHLIPIKRVDDEPDIRLRFVTNQVHHLQLHNALIGDKSSYKRQQQGRKQQGGCPIAQAVANSHVDD